jgi:hypothetical protein
VSSNPLPALNVITIPGTFDSVRIAELKLANPTSGFIQVLPATQLSSATPVPTVTAQGLSIWAQLAEGILGAGATLLVPGPWLPIVSLVVQQGVPWVEALIAGKPVAETWTLAQLQAEAARVSAVVPLT